VGEKFVPLTKVKRERTSDAVFNVLRESILNRTFLPGERINVQLLAQKLDVSVTPVSNAITRLVVEGLMEVRPRSGTYVSKLDPRDVEESLSVRLVLERLAAETIFENLTEEEVEWFTTTISLLERPVTNDRERQQHERRNNGFHLRLVELSGNSKLIEIYRSLNAHVMIARIHYTTDTWAKRLPEEQVEHRRILDALISRNVRSLQRSLEGHISRSATSLVDDLKRNAASFERS
jgi:GntR family transcriptional regulator, rspAB operon transcriptional repressor